MGRPAAAHALDPRPVYRRAVGDRGISDVPLPEPCDRPGPRGACHRVHHGHDTCRSHHRRVGVQCRAAGPHRLGVPRQPVGTLGSAAARPPLPARAAAPQHRLLHVPPPGTTPGDRPQPARRRDLSGAVPHVRLPGFHRLRTRSAGQPRRPHVGADRLDLPVRPDPRRASQPLARHVAHLGVHHPPRLLGLDGGPGGALRRDLQHVQRLEEPASQPRRERPRAAPRRPR